MRRETIAGAAALLAEAHRAGRRFDRLPPRFRPQDVATAYAIQDTMVGALGGVGGWKVGRTGNDEPRCAPMPRHRTFASGIELDAADYPDASLEIEFAFSMRTALPPRPEPYGLEEVAAAADLVPLIEIVGTRFVDLKAVDPLEKLADLSANAAFVVGRPIGHWRSIDLAKATIELSVDGNIAQTTTGHSPAGDPVALLVWLASHAIHRSGGLKSGDIVTTGALCGMTPIGAGSHATGRWGNWGWVEVSFAPA